MKKAALSVVVAVLALTGCGGSGHSASTQHCKAGDVSQACVLKTQPQPAHHPALSFVTARGIDFAWACPNPSGLGFGASYLSSDASKNWSVGCIGRYHAAGVKTVAVWETGATRATQGYAAGFSDARQAAAQIAGLGAPARQPFTMAIDCDCSGASVAAYFQGANAAEPGRVNAYGGYYPLLYLARRGLVGHLNWQTYAWSGGLWLPASIAPLEQWLNGSSVDYDRAIAVNYGQWPLPNPAPVYPVCYHHRIPARACTVARARVASYSWAQASSRRAFVARGCPTLAHRIAWFAGQLKAHPRTRVASRTRALGFSRLAYRQRSCGVFAHRVVVFGSLVATTEAAH